MVGLDPKLLVISDCMKMRKRRENAQNQGNKLRPDNNHSRKDASASAKAAHMVHCFWRKCSAVFDTMCRNDHYHDCGHQRIEEDREQLLQT